MYITEIKNKAQLRRLIDTSEKIANDSYENSGDIDSVLDNAERAIMEVTWIAAVERNPAKKLPIGLLPS